MLGKMEEKNKLSCSIKNTNIKITFNRNFPSLLLVGEGSISNLKFVSFKDEEINKFEYESRYINTRDCDGNLKDSDIILKSISSIEEEFQNRFRSFKKHLKCIVYIEDISEMNDECLLVLDNLLSKSYAKDIYFLGKCKNPSLLSDDTVRMFPRKFILGLSKEDSMRYMKNEEAFEKRDMLFLVTS